MAVQTLSFQQQVPASGDTVWAFFSDPHNLAVITPAYMNFRVLNEEPLGEIYPGMLIRYKVSPLMKVPMFWMTEITAVRRYRLFVDVQRRGPYKLWHHQHLFEENDHGVLMTDLVNYELPLGPLGNLAHSLIVRKQLREIFDYRRQKVEEIFGQANSILTQ
jgi:ligand-binding SRPBCC domain-containing protein